MKKQRTLPFLSSQDAEYNRLKSTRASARDAKLKTTTVPTPTTRTEPLPCSPLCSSRKRARSCLEKLSKSTRINSLKPASLEAISEIISDLCSTVSFIVLCLIRYFTTNIRTLELTHVLGTVSICSADWERTSTARSMFVPKTYKKPTTRHSGSCGQSEISE